jgi:hypothetical protein
VNEKRSSIWGIPINNVFQEITGDPVKIRDFSNFNTIMDNVFSKSGIEGAYFDHFNLSDEVECPSYENYFAGNIIDGKYRLDNGSCSTLPESYVRPKHHWWRDCCVSVDNPWKQMPCEQCEDNSRPECEGPWERVDAQNNYSTGNNCLCSGEEV